jgi:hypothetical protein
MADVSDKAQKAIGTLSLLWNKHKGSIKNVMNDVKKSLKFKKSKSKKAKKSKSNKVKKSKSKKAKKSKSKKVKKSKSRSRK